MRRAGRVAGSLRVARDEPQTDGTGVVNIDPPMSRLRVAETPQDDGSVVCTTHVDLNGSYMHVISEVVRVEVKLTRGHGVTQSSIRFSTNRKHTEVTGVRPAPKPDEKPWVAPAVEAGDGDGDGDGDDGGSTDAQVAATGDAGTEASTGASTGGTSGRAEASTGPTGADAPGAEPGPGPEPEQPAKPRRRVKRY